MELTDKLIAGVAAFGIAIGASNYAMAAEQKTAQEVMREHARILYQRGNTNLQDRKYDEAANNYLEVLKVIDYNPREPMFNKAMKALTSDIWKTRSNLDLAVIRAKFETAMVLRDAAQIAQEQGKLDQYQNLKARSVAAFQEVEDIGQALLKAADKQQQRTYEQEQMKKSLDEEINKIKIDGH